ncbi:MAG TPA: response regulator [Acidimicrobiales bacterium]|nr:response regulator [Acidimicrobiales bacterium]
MIDATTSTRIDLLLVEDDPGDAMMTREALAESGMDLDLHLVDNGEAAISFLRQESPYDDAPRPDLILLDLNLPRVDGREVLAFVKGDRSLRRIPLVVLSTSDSDDDIAQSYDLHANAFVTKPVDFDSFRSAVRRVDDFFLTVARLPPKPRG